MIVREILKQPELIKQFDFFNDAKDTINWLKHVGTPEAVECAKKLQEADDAYWKKRNEIIAERIAQAN
jgi:hypothetical protein